MKKSILVKKIQMNCPLCDKNHEVEERRRITTTIIKGSEIEYEERFFYCGNADEEENEFENGTMTNENLMNARNSYRIKYDLLTSNDIIEIRENYGLSQVDLARLLGWGDATISRYESKAIQDEAYDTMPRLIKDNPLKALEFLKKNSDKFSKEKMQTIREKVMNKLDAYGREFLTRQSLESEYVYYEESSDSNGNKTLDIDKIEAVVSYLAEHMANLYKVKLMKLLWYSDVLAYKQQSQSMTGLVYCHEAMGALPVGHYSLMNLENINVKEELSWNYDSMLHVYPLTGIDYSILSANERNVLDTVIKKFQNYKTKEIVEYMHEETAYKKTLPGAVIPFSLAKEIRAF